MAAFNPLIASPFSICSALADSLPTLNGALGANYVLTDGNEVSVEGNQLPGAPEFKIAGGVQYDARMGSGYVLTPRVDAYYQSESFNNIFNTEKDRIDGYAYLNGQVRFGPEDGNWYVRAFVQNITNNDAVTGIFDVGQSSGNFQNLFLLEPRRWGFGLNVQF